MMIPSFALLQGVAAQTLDGTAAQFVGWLPMLPLLGALINGAIAMTARARGGESASTARHTIVTFVGPGVILGSFALQERPVMRTLPGSTTARSNAASSSQGGAAP